MSCERVALPGGAVAIVCGRRRKPLEPCAACGVTATRQCDGKVPGRRGRTARCDVYLCDDHATPAGPGLDHCEVCANLAAAAPAVPAPAPSSPPPVQMTLPLRWEGGG